jgi:hypothetical protein
MGTIYSIIIFIIWLLGLFHCPIIRIHSNIAGLWSGFHATSGGHTGLGIDFVLLAEGFHTSTTSSRLAIDDVTLSNNWAEARIGDVTGAMASARAKMSAVTSMSSAESDVLSVCVLTDDRKGWRFDTGMCLLLMFDYHRLTSWSSSSIDKMSCEKHIKIPSQQNKIPGEGSFGGRYHTTRIINLESLYIFSFRS